MVTVTQNKDGDLNVIRGAKTVPIEEGSRWFGPFPPIPGEAEWGDQPYENVFESNDDGPSDDIASTF